ncbi:hypothetical protein, partial [Curtobacterium luteum]
QDPSFVDLMQRAGIDYYIDFRGADRPEVDYSDIGTTSAVVVAPIVCADVAGGQPSPCRVTVVELDQSVVEPGQGVVRPDQD